MNTNKTIAHKMGRSDVVQMEPDDCFENWKKLVNKLNWGE
jgi:hypothetical protein